MCLYKLCESKIILFEKSFSDSPSTYSVHLNPVITLAEFFALTTAWPMCCAMIIMQMLASVTAVAGFVVINY